MPNDYASYLREIALPQGEANLAAMQQTTEQLLQDMKNRSAPMISGGGGGSTYNGGGGGSMPPSSNPHYNSAAYRKGTTGPGTLGGGSYNGKISVPAGGKTRPVGGRTTSNWGVARGNRRHTGVDWGMPTGTTVRSAANGVVTRTGSEGAYGNSIHVRHKDGTTGLYAHLSGINVKPGQRVKSGQSIGKVGSTGRSTGPHLHFEVRKSDRYGGDINPNKWLSTR
jgi:murein DD-endopeptidase MepM/ murein hydrolase activator NlpD